MREPFRPRRGIPRIHPWEDVKKPNSEDIPHLERAVWAGMRVAKPTGGSCHVFLPKSLEGLRVVVVALAPEGEEP